MSRPEARVVVLFEGKADKSFLTRLVERLRLTPVRFENCHNNAGVLRRLVEEVDSLRARNFQKNLGLVVAVDADAPTHHDRLRDVLARIATQTGAGPRSDGERIALVIPAWEIENWYVHLCVPEARPIDEGKDYKPTAEWRELERDIGAAAKRAVEAWGTEPGRADPPSMVAARLELERVQLGGSLGVWLPAFLRCRAPGHEAGPAGELSHAAERTEPRSAPKSFLLAFRRARRILATSTVKVLTPR